MFDFHHSTRINVQESWSVADSLSNRPRKENHPTVTSTRLSILSSYFPPLEWLSGLFSLWFRKRPGQIFFTKPEPSFCLTTRTEIWVASYSGSFSLQSPRAAVKFYWPWQLRYCKIDVCSRTQKQHDIIQTRPRNWILSQVFNDQMQALNLQV
jgi:hypothetical protein